MYRPRVIPCLLLRNLGLVKSVRFGKTKYIGDPINTVKIFNELEADELFFLDIDASKEGRIPSSKLVKNIGDEAFMPFAVGGGLKKLDDIKEIINCGAEKVVLNESAIFNPELITQGANVFGSQCIVVSIDVKKDFFGKQMLVYRNGKRKAKCSLFHHIKEIENRGAGEIIINSVDKDGRMQGYDLELVKAASQMTQLPVVALGGSGSLVHMRQASDAGASAVAAGSQFVFHGPRKGILVNYPEKKNLLRIFQ